MILSWTPAVAATEESCPLGTRGWATVGLQLFAWEDTQVMILTVASLTQKNVTHNDKPTFAHPCIIGAANGI